MTLSVLICDDSRLARRQMARSLPRDWDISLRFAENGAIALELIEQGQVDLLFLDLNMPVMNGYEVLEQIRARDLPCMTLVVSGDIQAEARQRVLARGAMDFIKKPVSAEHIHKVLLRYGIYEPAINSDSQVAFKLPDQDPPDFLESLREVVNVAMGQAGSLLGELLNTFIRLPIPVVHILPFTRICRQLPYADSQQELSAVSHGFCGDGVAGEGIVMLSSDRIQDLYKIVASDLPDGSDSSAGILTDLSELLVGACLKGLQQQLDIDFNHSYPVVLGHRKSCYELLNCEGKNQSVLAIDITYQLLEPDLSCHLLLIITQDSIPSLQGRVALISPEAA